MDLASFTILKAVKKSKIHMIGGLFPDQSNRTMLMGTDEERNIWHTYLRDGHLHCLIYTVGNAFLKYFSESDTTAPRDFIPPRSCYPETCDFVLCDTLRKDGINITFSRFNLVRPALVSQEFYGMLPEELVVPFQIPPFIPSIIDPILEKILRPKD